jgi:hypothetical protein
MALSILEDKRARNPAHCLPETTLGFKCRQKLMPKKG